MRDRSSVVGDREDIEVEPITVAVLGVVDQLLPYRLLCGDG